MPASSRCQSHHRPRLTTTLHPAPSAKRDRHVCAACRLGALAGAMQQALHATARLLDDGKAGPWQINFLKATIPPRCLALISDMGCMLGGQVIRASCPVLTMHASIYGAVVAEGDSAILAQVSKPPSPPPLPSPAPPLPTKNNSNPCVNVVDIRAPSLQGGLLRVQYQ